MTDASGPTAQFPAKLQFLFEPHRYKVAYGGRDAAKSWSYAQALLILGTHRPLRILCAREIQESIEQSVHKLLCDRIAALELQAFYSAYKSTIIGPNGTQFTFHGLKHNIDNIKSIEGTDIVWVEEANKVSTESWEKLIDTIRKPGSEIWASFNPELDSDDAYVRFVLNTPTDAKVVHVTWEDNPWPSEVLRIRRETMFAQDPDEYQYIYGGHPRRTLRGAVYAAELRAAESEFRITAVPYDTTKGVHVFCDLGWGDQTALWFIQRVGLQWRVLRYYENRHQKWSHYLKYIEDTKYLVDKIWLPHDGKNEQLGADSIEKQTKASGRACEVLDNPGTGAVLIGINAVREKFPFMWFDAKGCQDGLAHLRRYVWDRTAGGLATRQPKHDEHSHCADAMRTFATSFRDTQPSQAQRAAEVKKKLVTPVTMVPGGAPGGWMR